MGDGICIKSLEILKKGMPKIRLVFNAEKGAPKAPDAAWRKEISEELTKYAPGPWLHLYNISAPCLLARNAFFEGGARIFRSLHFTYLPDVCLFDDDLPIANLEPGVSGRNSLPLTGTPRPGPLRANGFKAPLGITLDAPRVALDALLLHLGSPWSLFDAFQFLY